MSDRNRRPARDRIRAQREREAQRQRQRKRAWIISGSLLALIAIAVVIAVVVQSSRTTTSTSSQSVRPGFYQGPFAPVTLSSDGVATMAQPGVAKPVLVVYEDFQCPICHDFEETNGATVQQLAYQGKVKVVYHPFTIFLGRQPQQDNSIRAWSAARCVPASAWGRYHDMLFANQPPETTSGGFPVSQLLAIGTRIGLTSPAFRQCVSGQTFARQAVPVSERVISGGINGTPTVTLNGRTVNNQVLVSSDGSLRQMILSAH